ncbi:hypothetical protein [Kibdelosporangium aridum]|uniref:Glycoside-hydrolase family GH114 TIM-barrel domain-containing protein n=1 Tax=Kibdelosporangium aridum TaxID=2030 RepID=A0A1Y5Y549_KIBAR|nr:hypothetical protein [Kibdelosporangium aridum]SMD25680.1 hypothetical protein SAMN05661093_09264 [Kibdelosporangium aridum]
MTISSAIAFYYGDGKLSALARHSTVVLQADFYSPAELAWLADHGVRTLCYLSLTEDVGPPAPWQRDRRCPDWGGAYVHVGSPLWQAHVLDQAAAGLKSGFAGLFLDTLNIEFTYPEDLPHLWELISALREASGSAYVLANRGFGLLPELGSVVDGVLFESFSARWVADGYARWPQATLDIHAEYAVKLAELGVEIYALDYADTPELEEWAVRRAAEYGMPCFVSDKALGRI